MVAGRTVRLPTPGRPRVSPSLDVRGGHPEVHLPRQPIDGDLIERIAKGDTVAFETLYDRLAGNLLGFAQHVVVCGATAERAVTQSFVEVWRRAAEYDGSSDALVWIVGLCTERLRDLCPAPTDG